MYHFIVSLLVTAVSLLIMSNLSLGIRVKDFSAALVAALVLGLLNALLRPVLGFFFFPVTLLTFGLFSIVLNAIVFWVATQSVSGFRLTGGVLTALIAPIVLTILNAIIFWVLP